MNNLYFYISKILAPFLNPTNLLLIVLVILILIFIKSKKRIILNLLFINITILISISFLPLGNLGLKYLEKNFTNQKEYKNIKNIIVLAGGEKRMIISTKLAYKYNNSKIYYNGGNGYLIKNTQNYEPLLAKNFYNNLNFDIDRINFVGKSRNTIENFKQIKKLNLKNSETVLITSAYHMKRSMIIAKKLGLDLNPYASDFKYSSQISLLNKYQAFDVASNLSKFNLFFREILGIIAFKITGYT